MPPEAGDWQLAASMVIDGLAISEITQPRGSSGLTDEFGGMPHGQAWAGPQPIWSAPRLRCPLAGLNPARTHRTSPKASSRVFPPISRPKSSGWPPR